MTKSAIDGVNSQAYQEVLLMTRIPRDSAVLALLWLLIVVGHFSDRIFATQSGQPSRPQEQRSADSSPRPPEGVSKTARWEYRVLYYPSVYAIDTVGRNKRLEQDLGLLTDEGFLLESFQIVGGDNTPAGVIVLLKRERK